MFTRCIHKSFSEFFHWFTIFLLVYLSLFTQKSTAQTLGKLTDINAPMLSEQSRISLLTCSSGDMLYSVFGHSAVRVTDDSLHIDIVFNYGTFDFDTPYFTIKFMNGDLDYMLASTTYQRFMRSYTRENRDVYEGLLNLTLPEKQELWSYLVWNIQPANRAYRYDFFFDNCATRIRDILFRLKGIEYKDENDAQSYISYRDYIHSHLPEYTWTAQGIDLLLGAKTDRPANAFARAYLPVYLDSLFIDYNIISKQEQILVGDVVTYADSANSIFTADMLGWLLIVLSVLFTAIDLLKHRYTRWFDVLFFTVCALLSLLLWYLWLFTKHVVCSYNANVLWASVLYFPIIVAIIKNKFTSKPISCMIALNVLFLIAFIMLSCLNIQDTASMSVEVAFALLLRNGALLYKSYFTKR